MIKYASRDIRVYLTSCCNFLFIGENHSPLTKIDKDNYRCRACGEYLKGDDDNLYSEKIK